MSRSAISVNGPSILPWPMTASSTSLSRRFSWKAGRAFLELPGRMQALTDPVAACLHQVLVVQMQKDLYELGSPSHFKTLAA
jgi:hypothetical protein